jgi:hypothetical protein
MRRRVQRALNTRSFQGALRSTTGAIDLASIMVGVIVLGVIAGVIAASVFAVIPWAQNEAAKQNLDAVRTAESVTYTQGATSTAARYLDKAGLLTSGLLQNSTSVAVGTDAAGTCYVAVSKSQAGKVYYVTDAGAQVREYTSGDTVSCTDINALITGVGGVITPAYAVTAGGWQKYPVAWSSGGYYDAGYGAAYGEYFPTGAAPTNTGTLTFFNPYAATRAQSGVHANFYCQDPATKIIGNRIIGSVMNFGDNAETKSSTWTCPGAQVLYAACIGSLYCLTGSPLESSADVSKAWFSEASPLYKAPVKYVDHYVAAPVTAGWQQNPLPWGAGTDHGFGPYYSPFVPTGPVGLDGLAAKSSGTVTIYDAYGAYQTQNTVYLYWFCQNPTTGLVGGREGQLVYSTFSSTAPQTKSWACADPTEVLYAMNVGSSVSDLTPYYPQTSTNVSRSWFSGNSAELKFGLYSR